MKHIITTTILLMVCAAVFAVPSLSTLFPSFSEQQMEQFKQGTVIEAVTSDGQKITSIAPRGSQGMTIAAKADRIYDGFSVGAVSFIPYPESFKKLGDQEKEVYLFNLLRSISTQKGLTYISNMAGEKPTVLFKDSYLISNPDKKNSKIPDPVSTEVPSTYSCYAFQKDNRFGNNVYSVDYTIKNGDFLMEITNYTSMKYMGFSCVDKGALHMYLEVIEAEEGFVLFTNAMIAGREPEVKVLFITVDLPSAFLRRTTALGNWFKDRVNAQ